VVLKRFLNRNQEQNYQQESYLCSSVYKECQETVLTVNKNTLFSNISRLIDEALNGPAEENKTKPCRDQGTLLPPSPPPQVNPAENLAALAF